MIRFYHTFFVAVLQPRIRDHRLRAIGFSGGEPGRGFRHCDSMAPSPGPYPDTHARARGAWGGPIAQLGGAPAADHCGEVAGSNPARPTGRWGMSSIGRASVLQAAGQEFDSPMLHTRGRGAMRSWPRFLYIGMLIGRLQGCWGPRCADIAACVGTACPPSLPPSAPRSCPARHARVRESMRSLCPRKHGLTWGFTWFLGCFLVCLCHVFSLFSLVRACFWGVFCVWFWVFLPHTSHCVKRHIPNFWGA